MRSGILVRIPFVGELSGSFDSEKRAKPQYWFEVSAHHWQLACFFVTYTPYKWRSTHVIGDNPRDTSTKEKCPEAT